MVPNTTLVSKIVAENPRRPQPRGEGLINLLHAPPLPREVPDVKLRHHNETFTSDNRYFANHFVIVLMRVSTAPGTPEKK